MEKVNQGFTLLEILIVIGIISILGAITILAINPAASFQDARNSERRSEITQILNALTQWVVDGNSISSLSLTVCTSGSDPIGTDTGEIDLAALLVPGFIAELPEDPQNASATATGYTICQIGTSSRVTLAAPLAEGGETIEVSR